METKNLQIFYHEDDYCQIEILPLENSLLVKNTKDVIHEMVKEAEVNGFKQIYSRDEIKYPLSFLEIPIESFESILKENALSYYDEVYTGYSTQKMYKENTHAFGFENYLIFYEYDVPNNTVTKAWIVYKLVSQTLNITPNKLKKTLSRLALNFRLIIVDWNELMTINLKQNDALEYYIKNVL